MPSDVSTATDSGGVSCPSGSGRDLITWKVRRTIEIPGGNKDIGIPLPEANTRK